jgi:hypothetical protein
MEDLPRGIPSFGTQPNRSEIALKILNEFGISVAGELGHVVVGVLMAKADGVASPSCAGVTLQTVPTVSGDTKSRPR